MSSPIPVQTSAGLEPAFDLSSYYPIFIYVAAIVVFAIGAVGTSQILFFKPRKKTAVKLMPYESGVDPIGSAHMQFDVKFYLIAILFLVFDVELLFLYPWTVVAYSDNSDPTWRAVFGRVVFWEIIAFMATLAVAYVYAWRKGVLQWR